MQKTSYTVLYQLLNYQCDQIVIKLNKTETRKEFWPDPTCPALTRTKNTRFYTKQIAQKQLELTCSLWPCAKYTTRLPTVGRETRGPAQACQSSEFKHLFSPINKNHTSKKLAFNVSRINISQLKNISFIHKYIVN